MTDVYVTRGANAPTLANGFVTKPVEVVGSKALSTLSDATDTAMATLAADTAVTGDGTATAHAALVTAASTAMTSALARAHVMCSINVTQVTTKSQLRAIFAAIAASAPIAE